MRATATSDALQIAAGSSFGHQYDPSRAYSEYASYYAASRLAADPESLHLYRNGIFSAAAASGGENNMFRVSALKVNKIFS